MRDCQDRAVLKLRTDSRLNQFVCLHVHGCCGLIQNQNFGFPQQSSGQTQELPLTHAKSKERKLAKILALLNCNFWQLRGFLKKVT